MSVLRVATFRQPLVFVDIETNGLDHIRGRVIEVAAIRVEDGEITKTFRSLIDPDTPLPYYITNLTGIAAGDLAGAPAFAAIADELQETLDGALFVAHNVRFDYSFLKQEFARLGRTFTPKQLCTVRLSRALYPHEKGHKLADIIRRHDFAVAARHRAYDDAEVLWRFVQYIAKNMPPEHIEAAVAKQIKRPALPKGLEAELVTGLPETPGVYIFEDDSGQPLYVGKSVNIKKRVMSHFSRDHAESKEFKISQAVKNVRTEQTAGELSALLLESRLVKELQPVYNRQLRRKQLLVLVKAATDEGGYSTVQLHETANIDPTELSSILAVFPRKQRANQALETMAKTYDLCPKLLGLEKASGACFWYQLKKCRGACVGAEPAALYNARVHIAFEQSRIQAWPYAGPVVLEESSTEQASGIIVDQWCVLGQIDQQADCEQVFQAGNSAFDLDTYKILQSFLALKLNKLRVTLLPHEALQQLLAPGV